MLSSMGEKVSLHAVHARERTVVVDYDHCSYCGACVPVCPPDCITLIDATLLIDHDECTRCERCITVCPTEALSWSKPHAAEI